MSPPVAVILAAGLGKRLGDLTANRPKALLPLGAGGVTFLDFSLRLLLPRVSRAYVMGGHRFDVLTAHLAAQHREAAGKITALEFKDYERVNNIGTFLRAREAFANGAMLLNSDIVYHPAILDRAFEAYRADPGQSFLVVDDLVVLDEEQMKVTLNPLGHVTGINKKLPPEESLGEYIGILYLTAADARRAIAAGDRLVAEGKTNLYYEDAVAAVLPQIGLRVVTAGGHPNTEVDTPEDYARAKAIYDRLAREGALPWKE
ncbi:MAG TPA: NTP transferase domain-containing protein [Candidatus Thermoplasmatota archaeon]|nr:NTP transferase domain-containing protein [Candidatus Thermoplasmatota archaeon]